MPTVPHYQREVLRLDTRDASERAFLCVQSYSPRGVGELRLRKGQFVEGRLLSLCYIYHSCMMNSYAVYIMALYSMVSVRLCVIGTRYCDHAIVTEGIMYNEASHTVAVLSSDG